MRPALCIVRITELLSVEWDGYDADKWRNTAMGGGGG